MSSKSGFNVNFTEFEKTFYPLVQKAIPGAADRGLFNAAAEALRDADKEPPQTPMDKGDLRGSKTIETSSGMRTKGIKTVKKSISFRKLSVNMGFNIFYAAKVHESTGMKFVVRYKPIQNPGPKYLETKLVRNKEKYIKIVVWTIESMKL